MTILRQNCALIIAFIAAGAIILSVASFQYYNLVTSQITEVAKKDIRSNALIQSNGIANALDNKVTDIITNMEIMSGARSIKEGNVTRAQSLFESAQMSTSDFTQGYYWLDKNGAIVTYSEINSDKYPDYRGDDLSTRDYFTKPRDEHRPFMTSLKESVDNVTRVYIGYPIFKMSSNGSQNEEGQFLGVIVAAINPKDLGAFMQKQIPSQFASTTGLMDRDANILYSTNETFIGTNYYGTVFQSSLPAEIRDDFNVIIGHSLSGKIGAEDLSFQGNSVTIAYVPVNINGEHIWTAYIVYPHSFAGDVSALLAQQRNFSIIVIAAIAIVAALIAFFVISWNRNLQKAVNEKTEALLQAVNSLAQANKHLEAHDKMQQEFINVAAHELRTPIQPVLGIAELVNDEFTGKPEKEELPIDRESAEILFRNAKRLERLSSDILQVARIEGNKLHLDREVFDLNVKVRNVVKDIEATMSRTGGKKIDIEVKPYPLPLYVNADKPKIYEVIANLLTNAIKFTQKGTITIEVTTSKGEANPAAILRVRDTGSGIDSEIMPRLFTKFATKSDQGTGLGLYISKNIIEVHGGRIWAENNSDGKGATFTFTIPLVNPDAEEKDIPGSSNIQSSQVAAAPEPLKDAPNIHHGSPKKAQSERDVDRHAT